jgi:hypothetical protein
MLEPKIKMNNNVKTHCFQEIKISVLDEEFVK